MSVDLTSDVLLARLRRAREDRGLSQQEVADRLGVARTTLIAIESGQRRLQASELVQLAQIYDARLEALLRDSIAARPLAAQFRTALGKAPDEAALRSAVVELQDLAEGYVALEQLMSAPLVRRYPPARGVPRGDLDREAALLATEERRRLGLGDGPLPHLREVLELDVGLRVFAVTLPGRIAGLFALDEELGACVAVNSHHPWEKQRWSMAHEYAHFLTRRDRPEVTASVATYKRIPASERFADDFARHFLMPDEGVRRRWEAMATANDANVASLVSQADMWGVSLQAFTLRLEDLRVVRGGLYDRLKMQGLTASDARQALGLPGHPPDTDAVSRRMQALAVSAYVNGDLSEERFAHLLRVDRAAARKLAIRLVERLSDAG